MEDRAKEIFFKLEEGQAERQQLREIDIEAAQLNSGLEEEANSLLSILSILIVS